MSIVWRKFFCVFLDFFRCAEWERVGRLLQVREDVQISIAGSVHFFCILKTTGSAGGSKKLSLCPDYLSERSEESSSLLLREKGDHGSGG